MTLGHAKFLYDVGKEYAEIFRGSVTGGAMLTFLASHFGLSKPAAVTIGLMLVPLFVTLAVLFGAIVIHRRIRQEATRSDWKHNDYLSTHIGLLKTIEKNTRRIEAT